MQQQAVLLRVDSLVNMTISAEESNERGQTIRTESLFITSSKTVKSTFGSRRRFRDGGMSISTEYSCDYGIQ